MARRKTSEPKIEPADSEPKIEAEAAKSSAPLLLEGPKASTESSVSAPTIELEALHDRASAGPDQLSETIAPEQHSHWRLPSYVPIAAAIVFAVALGAIAGAAATSSLLGNASPPADMVASNAN